MSASVQDMEKAAPELFAAVSHLLRRIGEDPGGVGYYAGFATEVFGRATRAYAKATNQEEDDVVGQVLDAQKANRDLGEELRALQRRVEELMAKQGGE